MTFSRLLLVLGSVGAIAAAPSREFIFTSAPFASSHASTIVELRNGDLLAAWFGGSAEGKPDVAIWSSRRTNGRWTAPAELAREPNIACYNPVLFFSRDGRLWFYYKFGPHPTSWTAARRWSDDDGKTWSPVEHLPAGLYGPIRAKPLVLKDGTIVSGTSVESYHSWACWIERSTDNGRTCRRIGPITPPLPSSVSAAAGSDDTYGIIQPSVVLMKSGKLRLYARSRMGRIYIADSLDAGLSWSVPRALDVPNPNSGIDAVALPDGRIVLVYNNTTHGRTPLNLAVSRDGEHFQMFLTLESEPGEYSYPALILGRDAALHITYTWKRKRICYVRIPVADVPQ